MSSDWDTGDSWDTGAGGSRDVLKDVTNSPTRQSEDDGGWGKPTKKFEDDDSQKATWSHDEASRTGDAGDKPAGGCFRCGADDHMKSDCPDKPAGGCFRCGSDDHMKADCPEPPKPMGECFNCSRVGHSKADCTNERVARAFTGTCNLCQVEGHRASECPTAPPKLCRNCEEPETDTHTVATCTNRRKIHRGPVLPGQAEDAWEEIISTSNADYWDSEEIKPAIKRYTDAIPTVTYVQLEEAFRIQGLKVYLVAVEKHLTNTFTNVDLQGNIDRKYAVWVRKEYKPNRPYEADCWPATYEENKVAAADAVNSHWHKNCKDAGPPVVPQGSVVHCHNCNEDGHRQRDCTKPREDKNACRNCKQSGHQSRECPEPRNLDTAECNKCNETGHYSRDCPKSGGGGGGCLNCDSTEHQSKECPLPRDFSRVKCRTCGEMGHTASRCKSASTDENVGDVAAPSSSWDHSSRDVSSSAPIPTKTSSSGWAKVSKGDAVAAANAVVAGANVAVADVNVAVAHDGGWGVSSISEPVPLRPAAARYNASVTEVSRWSYSSSSGNTTPFTPAVAADTVAVADDGGWDISSSPSEPTPHRPSIAADIASLTNDSLWGDSFDYDTAPASPAPLANTEPAESFEEINLTDDADTVYGAYGNSSIGANPAPMVPTWSRPAADEVIAAQPVTGLWSKAAVDSTIAQKPVAQTSATGLWSKPVANNAVVEKGAADKTVSNKPVAAAWDSWGIPATVGVVDATTGTDRTPENTGWPCVSARNANISGGPAALKPLFYDDGKNRHNNYSSAHPYPVMVPETSARDEKEDEEIPRAGGFGGGASSPEQEDVVDPWNITPVATNPIVPAYGYQPSRAPITSAPRQQKPSGPPYGVSLVFPKVRKVSPVPAPTQSLVPAVGRVRQHSIVQPTRPLMAAQFTTPSPASTAQPSVVENVAPGGSIGRPRRQSIAQQAGSMMTPRAAAPSAAFSARPSPVVAQGVAPGGSIGQRSESIFQSVQRSPPQMTATSTVNGTVPPHLATPSRPPPSDLPFRNMEFLERTPPPHGLDVFFDGDASESAVVDDELPTPTLPGALAPPEESW